MGNGRGLRTKSRRAKRNRARRAIRRVDGFVVRAGRRLRESTAIFRAIFVRRFLRPGDRTIDQMVQAARSGKQNIIEGSEASATSKETELKLTNVAKASLEELLEDYLDYLKTHRLLEWPKDSETGLVARRLGREEEWERLQPYFEKKSGEVVANLMVSLIRQCTYLLAKQIAYLEEDFKRHGGIRERMYAARSEPRFTPPQCPLPQDGVFLL